MRLGLPSPQRDRDLLCARSGPESGGVTHECDFPPQAAYKTVMTRNLLELEGAAPAEVDRHVRAALHEGSSLYALDQEALRRARPDLILTQELCEVCAVAYTQVLEAAKLLPGKPTVVSLEPHTLADVLRSIGDVGQVTGTPRARGRAGPRALGAPGRGQRCGRRQGADRAWSASSGSTP